MTTELERKGPFGIRGRRIAYETPWIKVDHHDVIGPDGKDSVYGVVRFANLAVGVLPLFANGEVPLVGQHRFPFDVHTWEIPEGGCPRGELPMDTARRELAEETGLRAGHILDIGSCQMSNSVSDEEGHFFVAWDLTEGDAAPEPTEVLEHRRVPFAQLLNDVMDGTIVDALTILIVQRAALKAMRGELPKVPTDIILSQLASR